MSDYEKTHYVRCVVSTDNVRSVIFNPNGQAMTFGELCTLINTLQDDIQTLKDVLQNIVDMRNTFGGPSLDYMQGYRDGQQYIQERAKLGLSAVIQE